jgi:RNA polymerase sigma-70 factor, ECF subfamily
MTDALTSALLDALGAAHTEAPTRLAARAREAREAWPEVTLSDAAFASGLARHAPAGELDAWLDGLEIADLFLALACAAGDAEALRSFEARYTAELTRLVHRFERPALSAEDIVQLVYERVLVHTPERHARILEYSGRGHLQNWLRVSAIRMAIDLTRSAGGAHELLTFEPERILDAADPGLDPELDLLKQKYRADFKVALHAALGHIPVYERNLLRQHLVGAMSIDQLAALYHIHRSTAARHLAHARELLLKETRRELSASLSIAHKEFDSIMALIASNLDVSLSRVLRERDEAPDDAT